MRLWNSKRVFFATPQVIQNDINDPLFPVNSIKLVCVDEAHKAKGKYAYCEVIKAINAVNQKFRVVALSATPGKSSDVIDIIKNLLIARLEVRTENSIDVKQYTFVKEIVVVQVKLEELTPIRDHFVRLIDPYQRKLIDFKVINGNTSNKGYIIMLQKKFQNEIHPHKAEVKSLFSIVISLLYSLDLLERHGIHVFLNSFKDDNNATKMKYFVALDRNLKSFLNELNEKYEGTNPQHLNVNPLPTGDVPSIVAKDLDYGHPKYPLLKAKLLEYFSNGGTKTIIFCEFRETVMLVYTMLLQLRPTLLPRMLIGQGGAVSQKDQLAVMKDFRSNKVNCLVTTSVCEEGIDVGEVDLVVCFDINSKSSTRFVQRIGRTGRKRKGKVIILASEGHEEELIRDVIANKDKLNKSIHTNKEVAKSLYRNSPRLVPGAFMPKCVETKFNIPDVVEEPTTSKAKKMVAKKGKKIVPKIKSISSHFMAVNEQVKSVDTLITECNQKDEAEEVTLLVPVQEVIACTLPTDIQLDNVKSNFNKELELIMTKISDCKIATEYFKLTSEKDLAMLDNLTELFLAPAPDDYQHTTVLNCSYLFDESLEKKLVDDQTLAPTLITPHESIINSDELESPKIKFKFIETQSDQFIEMDSRYGNQFSVPEPFNTPFKNVPFRPVNTILNDTMKASPAGPSSSKKIMSANRKRPSIADSPLIKAFQRQKSLSSSTPVASRSASRFDSPSTSTTMQSIDRTINASNKSALEYFGINSVDDIFDGMDTFSNATSAAVQEDSFAKLLDDDNEIFLDVSLDEVIESSMVEAPQALIRAANVNSNANKENSNEFNLDEIFGISSSSSHDLDKNIVDLPSDFSQQTQVYDVEVEVAKENLELSMRSSISPLKGNVHIVNSAIITITSPAKSPPPRPKPNISKLLNALKTSNFLSLPDLIPLQQNQSPVSRQRSENVPSSSTPKVSSYESPKAMTPKITKFLSPFSRSTAFHSPISSRQKKLMQPTTKPAFNDLIISSEDDAPTATQSPFTLPIRKKFSRKRKRNEFLDTQAGVDGPASSDEDDDETLDGFIAHDTDSSENEADEVDMRAKYMQSLKSPSARQNGNFKIPQLRPMQSISMIFSQVPQEEDDDWEMDSFIVNNEDQSIESQMDELEMAEKILKEKRQRAKRLKNGTKRRKVVRSIGSSDEDDELKDLRNQLISNPD